MSTPHNEANLGDIAKTVIMPGDPLRAKYIAENFLDDYKLVNQVRGMYAYTGHYKGTEITVMASGMGIPSMGIYCYELFKFYDVENIIRIGSCGGFVPELNMFDIVLSKSIYSESNFALTFNNENCHIVDSSSELNNIIKETSLKIFKILGCKDFSRVDFLYDEKNNKLYFNEINTIPGFTTISMFPKLFEYDKIKYKDLITKLILNNL